MLHDRGAVQCRKTATEEDRGEDNKDSDWLIEQSIARQVDGGCCTAPLQSLQKSRTEFYFVQRCAQQKCGETSCRGNMLHRAIL